VAPGGLPANDSGLRAKREDVYFACAHPCLPSVLLPGNHQGRKNGQTHSVVWLHRRTSWLRWRRVPTTYEPRAEDVIRIIYSPVVDLHWVAVKQLAVLEPTLVETIACMLGAFVNVAPQETVKTGVPERAAKAMLFGHTQMHSPTLCDNPFSIACLITMDYGRENHSQGGLEEGLRRS